MPKPKAVQPDLVVENLGSLWAINAVTEAAQAWVEEHVWLEPLFGNEKRFLADHRPARDIVEGARADGLVAVWG